MEKLTPRDLREILVKLQEASLDAVVVGGQAVNLWAFKYYENAPALKELLPFASEDLDFYGGKLEVLTCRDTLQGKATLNQDFDPSPNSGVVIVNYQERSLRIDFLASVYGLNDAEITSTALPFSGREPLTGVKIKVLHPLLCLEGKLKCLRGLPQQGRQDLKHVKMSLICVGELLKDFCQRQEPRSGLKLIERVLKDALTEDGLSAWYHHQVEIESAIPLDVLSKLTDDKWQKFCEIRLPKAIEQISVKRNHYLEVMDRIVARVQNQELKSPITSQRLVETTVGDEQASSFAKLVVESALNILDTLKSDVYVNDNYRLARQGEILIVVARDGRGEIARSVNGVATGAALLKDSAEIERLSKAMQSPEIQRQNQQQLQPQQKIDLEK